MSNSGWLKYEYYDTPDGEDTLKKAFFCAKYGFVGGALFAVHDMILYSKPKGYANIFGRFMYVTTPFVAIPVATSAAINISTSLRNKDDNVNYVIGGLVGGGVFGSWRRSAGLGLVVGVMLAVIMFARKEALKLGHDLFGEAEVPQTRSVMSPYFDFTLTKDRPGNWSRD